jgi:hypothetical protein
MMVDDGRQAQVFYVDCCNYEINFEDICEVLTVGQIFNFPFWSRATELSWMKKKKTCYISS